MPPPPTLLDGSQVLQHAFEEPTGRIRTTSTATIIGGDMEVDIVHTEDSVRLGDGTNLTTATVVGSKVGLDVNIINVLPNTPKVYNVSVPLANTEVSFALPVGTKSFLIKIKNESSLMKLSFDAGTSGTTYVTVNRGSFYASPAIAPSGVILYFQTTQAAQTAEVVVWRLV